MRYTFGVAKCYRIFEYLLQEKQIKLSSGHVIPSSKQLKKHAYYKWHNSYSHATNDCNVFRQHVQSTINEGQLKFTERPQIKLDKDPFSANMNMVELDGTKGLIWPSQAESTKGKEVIIGEERPPKMIKPKSSKDGQW
jgi:GH43 family beta-xylosidase